MEKQQKWKIDPTLYNAPTEQDGLQVKKKLDYDTTYRKEFLDADPLRDWESIDRSIWLWDWAMQMLVDEANPTEWAVLDVGTKDAQFPEWLREQSVMGIGIEYSEPYVRYAVEKGRPTMYGNACAMEFEDNSFDFVFSHHLHGLLPDYLLGLQEMFRVTSKYMIALNQVPGNPRKHYSYIDNPQIYHDFIESVNCEVIYNDFLATGFSNEWVIFLKKIQPEGYQETEKFKEKDDVIIDSEFKPKKYEAYF
jgi:SAM-dependent methyltransferase